MKKYTLLPLVLSLLIQLFNPESVYSQGEKEKVMVDFDSENFQVYTGEIIDHQGRKAFKGTGGLPDINFKNGIVEVDMIVTGERSYPGINFRVQSRNDYEHFYIRPHRAGLYPDALQYTPCSGGIDSWQLFNGDGYTSDVVIPTNEWFHVKLEVKGSQACVYVNGAEQPSLQIHELYHGISEGSISINCPLNNTAYFSNLSYSLTDEIYIAPPPIYDTPVGMIAEWELSQPFGIFEAEFDKTPSEQKLDGLEWKHVKTNESGLVNIGDHFGRKTRAGDFIFAKTSIDVDNDTSIELKFGYSDAIVIFLNEEKLFVGNSAYTQRDPSFLGIIGLNDAVYLPLKKGNNELLISLVESFGGWGFICQDGNATYFDERLQASWKAEGDFKIPESILWDPERDVLYVTNFDQFSMGNPTVFQFISKLSLDGELINLKWVDSLNNPLGMTIYGDRLYVAERNQVAVISLEEEEIINRIEVPGSVFLNDIAIDNAGRIYVSDSRKNVIWRISKDHSEEWLTGPDVIDPNALYIYNENLLFGNSGDSWLKSVKLDSKEIVNIARFPKGFIDGIRVDLDGNLLVSLWKGKIYKVNADGSISLVFHTQNKGFYSADFEYIPHRNLLIIPTFYNNAVHAYRF
jgi:sugar lactone lactonase YvrE